MAISLVIFTALFIFNMAIILICWFTYLGLMIKPSIVMFNPNSYDSGGSGLLKFVYVWGWLFPVMRNVVRRHTGI